jgi:bis(5'-nucleosyl)-tetraphosphatase (symmetrical)
MRTFAIGDIQGCFAEFDQLLEQIQFDPQRDRLWLVGDLVNRGPQSLEVLRKVKALGAAAVTVLGNHDLHLLAAALSPAESLKPKDTLGEIFAAPDRDELLHWLRHRSMLHSDDALGYTMVHAGLAPQWTLGQAQACARELEIALRDDAACVELFANMYGDQPDRWSDDLKGFARLRFITNCFTRMRFCSLDGRLELKYKGSLSKAPRQLVPWFQVPQRQWQGTRIVCGHWSALGFHRSDDVLAIDTGCVWGDRLCAVRLDQRDPAPIYTPCSSSGLAPDT